MNSVQLTPIAALVLAVSASAQLIQPDSATTGSAFSSSYGIHNAINGSGFGPDFALADPHQFYSGGNHWTTQNGAIAAGTAHATFFFGQDQTINRFHLWNHRSNNIAANPYYAVTQFDLQFFDGSGNSLGAFLDVAATGGVGDGAAETFALPAMIGVRSVHLHIDANSEPAGHAGTSYTGVAEVAFSFVEGVNFCTSSPNSSGDEAKMDASGSSLLMGDGLTLEASGMPATTFGIFVVSQSTGSVPLAEGTLCLSGVIGRYQQAGQVFQANSNGRASLPIDAGALPQGAQLVAASAGETWHFQAWFRDVVAGQQTANLTDGISITFN